MLSHRGSSFVLSLAAMLRPFSLFPPCGEVSPNTRRQVWSSLLAGSRAPSIQQKWLVPVARYKEHTGDPRDTPQNSNCNKLYSRHVPVVGVSVVCAVPNGTFIALAPTVFASCRVSSPPIYSSSSVFLTSFPEGKATSSGDTYHTFITHYVYLQNFSKDWRETGG